MTATDGELFTYAGENGLEISGPTREVYLTDPGQVERPEDNLTLIQFPV